MFEPQIKLEHQDSRGEIYSIQLPDDRELMLIHSTAGAKRGGHSHDCHEIVSILSGKMLYRRIMNGQDMTMILTELGSSNNMAGEIHMGEFLEDTWLIEYKLAPKDGWTQENYQPFRKQVRESQQW